MEKSVFETCPFCSTENNYPEWDADKQGFVAICKNCGEQIFLCDECLNREDNPGQVCDWHLLFYEGRQFGLCHRGSTANKEKPVRTKLFDYKTLADTLLDFLCELNSPNETIQQLKGYGYEKEDLCYLGFDVDAIKVAFEEDVLEIASKAQLPSREETGN